MAAFTQPSAPKSEHSHLAPFCADSVEQCKQFPEIVAVGTYQLDEETRVRHGGFQLLNCEQENSAAGPSNFSVKCSSFVGAPGVLDAKWSTATLGDHHASILASATATGVVELYSLNAAAARGDEDGQPLTLLCTSEQLVADDDSMALSLDWDNRRSTLNGTEHAASGRIAVSSTHSSVHVFEASPAGFEEISSWRAHEFFGGMDIQVWITAFNAWDTQVLLTGADDSKCKMWDLRMGDTALWTTSCHGAGVGSAQWSHLLEHVFATGSYDGTVAIWDNRNKRSPLLQQEQGGGVWRIKWHPRRANVLATAAMRGGFHVLTVDGLPGASTEDQGDSADSGGVTLRSDCRFDGHAALADEMKVDLLAYGVDWVGTCSKQKNHEAERHLVSCSFYDKAVHAWCGLEK